MIDLTAAILAGGAARRFGGCAKGELLVEGVTILDRQLAELRQVTDDILIIGGPATSRRNVRVIPDLIPGRGPLGGLHTALTESHATATLLLACDLPYVTAPFLRHLASLAVDVDAVVPRTERGYHPLCAVYGQACLEPAARHLGDGQLRMTDLLHDLRVRVVTGETLDRFGDQRRLLTNVNTPDDYRQLVEIHQA